jgi:predicted RNA-binding Zn-ribbon protein involved in translation (DUF1610 family)
MTSADTADASRSKATLFCQTCGHESSIWGDWDVRSTTERTTTSCPECGTTVDERPAHDQRDGPFTPLPGGALLDRMTRTLESVGASLTPSGLLVDPRP